MNSCCFSLVISQHLEPSRSFATVNQLGYSNFSLPTTWELKGILFNGSKPLSKEFTCRWSLPLYNRKNLPWIQHAPRSVCPGQSNQPKEIPWFLLHRLLGSWSSGPQAVNRRHRKGKPGLPFGRFIESRVQDQQPVTWILSKNRVEEKATERTGTMRFYNQVQGLCCLSSLSHRAETGIGL